MRFDLNSATRRKLGYRLIDSIDEYFSSLPDRNVQLPKEARTYGPLDGALPEHGEDPGKVLEEVFAQLSALGFHTASANYFGLMNPTPTYMGVLGEAMVAALNPQLATLARSQLASKIELETIRWIGERVGWASDFNGTFTSGGNEANFSGMALAMAAKFPKAIEEGVAAIGEQPVAFASSESHHSLDKSAGLLGIGRQGLRRVAVNDRAQMDPQALEREINAAIAAGKKPFCVVATAGTTNSGSVDDLNAIAEICRRHDLWLHVDGAYGAAAIFSDKHRNLMAGIEHADSLTIDPHKWLAVPFVAGVILTSHPEVLQKAFSVAAPYMPKASGAMLPDNSRISTQWTRRMNSLKLWLTLRVHGRAAYEDLIDRQLHLAHSFAEWVRQSEDFEIFVPPTVPIVTFRLKSPGADAHAQIVDSVTGGGDRLITDTIVNGDSVLRVMVVSYLTEERHLEALQHALTSAARELRARATSRR